MAQFDANIKLLVDAQQAFKLVENLEKKLNKISDRATKVKVAGVISEEKAAVKAAEARLSNQIRLNAALERQANLLKGLTRAGVSGDRKSRVDELTQVGKKFSDNLRIQSAVNTGLEKELETLREINRTKRAQNANDSKVLTTIRKRIQLLKAVGATEAELNKITKQRDEAISRNSKKQTDLAKESFSKLDRQLSNLERKYGTFLGKPGRQLASPIRGSKDTPGSPLYLEAQARAADKAAAAQRRLAEQIERTSRVSGPRSPIRGSETLVGSPKFLAAEARKLNQEENRINKTLDDQRRLREKNAKAAKRTADQVARKAANDLKATRKNQAAGVVGAGFPLLFGGGPGSVIGGALGGILGGKELGFELSVGLGALGSVIDRLVASARNLGDAFSSVDTTLDQVKNIGFDVNKATEKRIELLVEEGRAVEAFLLVLETTGITSQQVQNLRELDTAFDDLQDSFAKLFVTVVSELTPAIVVVTNLLKDVVNGLTGPEIQRAAADLDPQAFQAAQIKAGNEASRFGIVGDRRAAERILTEESRKIVANAAPKIDTSQLENVNTFTEENLDLLEKRTAAIEAGNDLTKDSAYEAAKEVIIAREALEIAKAENNENEKKLALARKKLSLAELEASRNKQLAAAAKKAQREEKQVQQGLASEKLKQFDIETKLVALTFDKEQALKDEIARLDQRAALEREQILLSTEDSRLQAAKLDTLQQQQNLKKEELQIQLRQLETERAIAKLKGQQKITDTRTGLEQELARKQLLPTGDQFGDALNQQKLDQAIRYENTIRGITDQIAALQEEARGNRVEDPALTQRIKDLQDLKATYDELLPAIFAAEQAQLRFSQTLSLVQGPVSAGVNSLVSGLREVAAGTKTAEEAFADFLTSIADQLINTAAQMIAQYIAIGIARQFAGIPAAGSGTANFGGFGQSPSSALGGLSFLANGGPATAGKPYIVGEQGPELFVPGRSGTVVPNDAMGGGNEVVINNTFTPGPGGMTAEDQARVARQMQSIVTGTLMREKRPGGILSK